MIMETNAMRNAINSVDELVKEIKPLQIEYTVIDKAVLEVVKGRIVNHSLLRDMMNDHVSAHVENHFNKIIKNDKRISDKLEKTGGGLERYIRLDVEYRLMKENIQELKTQLEYALETIEETITHLS